MVCTVGQALECGLLKSCQLIAGESGLDRVIRGVGILDAPGSIQWLRGGEIVLTVGNFVANTTAAEIAGLLKALAARNAAAVAIKCNRYVSWLGEEIVSEADALSIPLLGVASECNWNDLIRVLFQAIYRSDFVLELLENKFSTNETIIARAATLGCKLEHGGTVMVVELYRGNKDFKKAQVDTRLRNDVLLACECLLGQLWPGMLSARIGSRLCAILPASNDSSCSQMRSRSIKVAKKLLSSVVDNIGEARLIIGIGNYRPEASELPRSLSEAMLAIQLSQSQSQEKSIIHYSDLGVYQLFAPLVESSPTVYRAYVDRILGPLLQYKPPEMKVSMLNTLRAFFDNNCSFRKTAKVMHVHPSTIKYRISKARKILGMDLTSPNNRLALHLALKFHDAMSSIESHIGSFG